MSSLSHSKSFEKWLWLLTIVLVLTWQQVESFVLRIRRLPSQCPARTGSATTVPTTSVRRHASSSDQEANDNDDDDAFDWDQEETLLVMHMTPLPDQTLEKSLQRVSQYTQSFPFAAVLPVQPLQYLPTGDGGVELNFLRKKTDIKSGIDGGIRFFVRSKENEGLEDDSDDVVDVEEEVGDDNNDPTLSNVMIEVVAKRNSKGQSISKIFAEKLVIQAFVKGMTMGADESESGSNGGPPTTTTITTPPSSSPSVAPPKTRFDSPTKDMVALESVFHKWM